MFDFLRRLFKPAPAVAAVRPDYVFVDDYAEPAPLPTHWAPFLSSSDLDILARTLYGECRGEPEDGIIAVVHVVRNRVVNRNSSAQVECLRPWQFSCWNTGSPALAKVRGLSKLDPSYVRLSNIARKAWDLPDVTKGARHYYSPKGMQGVEAPSWTMGPGVVETLRIGGHIFYAGVR